MPTEKAMRAAAIIVLGRNGLKDRPGLPAQREIIKNYASIIDEEMLRPDIKVKAGQLWTCNSGNDKYLVVAMDEVEGGLILVNDPRGRPPRAFPNHVVKGSTLDEYLCGNNNWAYLGMFKDIIAEK